MQIVPFTALSLAVWMSAAASAVAGNIKPAESPAQDPNSVQRRSAVVDVTERFSPAVVNIHADEVVQTRLWSDNFLKDMLEPRYEEQFATTSLGSGVLIDPHHVLTNHHVVAKAERVRIRLSDRRRFSCTIVGMDPDLDLAVLRVQTEEDLPFVDFADSRNVLVGETVIAIGNPFGLHHTVTSGVVSAQHRSVHAPERTYHDFIQTDASINPGNSGGPLLDIEGHLVGINTAMFGNAQGIGFAIPANRARNISRELIATGKIRPLYLGVDVRHIEKSADKEIAQHHAAEGVLVDAVDKSGPAGGKISAGDIILNIDGFPILTEEDYIAKLRDFAPGNVAHFGVKPKGKSALVKVKITFVEAPETLGEEIFKKQLGATLKLSNDASEKSSAISFVIEKVRDGSAASKAKLQVGDRLQSINETDVKDGRSLTDAISLARRGQVMRVTFLRGTRSVNVAFKI